MAFKRNNPGCTCCECVHLRDGFNRSALGSNWSAESGGWSIDDASGGQDFNYVQTSDSNALLLCTVAADDPHRMKIQVSPTTGDEYKVVVAYTDAANYLFALVKWIYVTASESYCSEVKLYQRASGSNTQLGDTRKFYSYHDTAAVDIVIEACYTDADYSGDGLFTVSVWPQGWGGNASGVKVEPTVYVNSFSEPVITDGTKVGIGTGTVSSTASFTFFVFGLHHDEDGACPTCGYGCQFFTWPHNAASFNEATEFACVLENIDSDTTGTPAAGTGVVLENSDKRWVAWSENVIPMATKLEASISLIESSGPTYTWGQEIVLIFDWLDSSNYHAWHITPTFAGSDTTITAVCKKTSAGSTTTVGSSSDEVIAGQKVHQFTASLCIIETGESTLTIGSAYFSETITPVGGQRFGIGTGTVTDGFIVTKLDFRKIHHEDETEPCVRCQPRVNCPEIFEGGSCNSYPQFMKVTVKGMSTVAWDDQSASCCEIFNGTHILELKYYPPAPASCWGTPGPCFSAAYCQWETDLDCDRTGLWSGVPETSKIILKGRRDFHWGATDGSFFFVSFNLFLQPGGFRHSQGAVMHQITGGQVNEFCEMDAIHFQSVTQEFRLCDVWNVGPTASWPRLYKSNAVVTSL